MYMRKGVKVMVKVRGTLRRGRACGHAFRDPGFSILVSP